MLHGSHSLLHGGGGRLVVVEERGGKLVTASDARYVSARIFVISCFDLDLWDTATVTAGYNEDGEMGVKMFDFANNLLENFHVQDGEMMNRRLTFEDKEAKPRFKVTYGLDEAGRLEMVVTVEVSAEEDLQKMTSYLQEYTLQEYFQNISGQNLVVSYIKKFHRIK